MSTDTAILLEKLPPYQGRQRMVTRRQDTFDIIREMMKGHREHAAHYDEICEDHWQGDTLSTCRHLFSFMRNEAPYLEEKTMMQTVKTPAAIITEGGMHFRTDCKHYASYIVGVLQALERRGYPVRSFYRYANYNAKKSNPGHVFAVCVINGKEVWIDPVPQIAGFDSRTVAPVSKIDKIPPMSKSATIGSLYRVSGLGNEDTVSGHHHHHHRGFGHWLDEYGPRAVIERQERRFHLPPPPGMSGMADSIGKHTAHKKAHHTHHHHGIHIKIKPGKLLLKVTMAPSRGAFLLLTELNMFNLGVNMWKHAAYSTSSPGWAKLQKFWKKIGGKPGALMKAIKKGVGTHNKLHKHSKVAVSGFGDTDMYGVGISGGLSNSTYVGGMDGDSIGFAPAVVAAIAAAAPLIAEAKSLLKSFGLDVDHMNKAGADATEDIAKKHNDKSDDGEATDGDGTTHDDGTKTAVTDNPDGTQTLHIKDVPGAHAADQDSEGHDPETGEPTGDGGGDDPGGDHADKTPAKHDGGFAAMLHTATSFVADHKTYFIMGGVVLLAAVVLPKILHKGPKRRR